MRLNISPGTARQSPAIDLLDQSQQQPEPIQSSPNEQHLDDRIRLVVDQIRSDLRHQWPQAELARAVNLSTSRFRHLFKSELGSSPSQYLKQLRLERARELLETSCLTVKEIAGEVGALDDSHFRRDFKRASGLSPTRYRSQALANKLVRTEIARSASCRQY